MTPIISINSMSHRKTDDLLRLLLITASLSILLILTISSYGFYRIFSRFVIVSAEEDGVMHCEELMEMCGSHMIRNDSRGMYIAVDPRELPELDRKLRKAIPRHQILKIKVYDAERRIVYSNESNLIGLESKNNPRLQRAMQGRVDSELVTNKQVHDISEERVITADVVETYIPIRNSEGKPVGSFEIYMNVSKYTGEMQRGLILAVFLLTMVSTIVYGSSFIIIRSGTKRLREFQGQLEMMAVTDTLTGLSNRRHLIERGEEEYQRAARQTEKSPDSTPLGCIMIDIDRFKQVNDTLGHLVGDQVIREVGKRLLQSTRPYDVVGRYGGEEFVVLLPDADFENTRKAAERIWQEIRREPVTAENSAVITVTVSAGIASLNRDDTSLDDLLKRADQGMYKAKGAGRDRIAWLEPQPAPPVDETMAVG